MFENLNILIDVRLEVIGKGLKINEDKLHSKERLKNHPRGCEMPMLETRQVIFGDEEVFTNLEFVQICTLPLLKLEPKKMRSSFSKKLAACPSTDH